MRETGHQIMMGVCRDMNLRPEDVMGKGITPELLEARRVIARRMKALDYLVSAIARRLRRHHSTIYTYLDPTMRRKKLLQYTHNRRTAEGVQNV